MEVPPLSTSSDPAVLRPWFNRRVNVRYQASSTTAVDVQGKPGELGRGRVQDISRSGLALLLQHSLEAGTEVLIRVKNEALDLTYDLAARVVHSSKKDRDLWIVGCHLSRELTEAELETLLV